MNRADHRCKRRTVFLCQKCTPGLMDSGLFQFNEFSATLFFSILPQSLPLATHLLVSQSATSKVKKAIKNVAHVAAA